MESESVVAALGALAQGTRLATIKLLVRSDSIGLPAGEIAKALGVPKNTMSSHLNILAQGGLVTSERQSRSIIYRLNDDALRDITAFLQGLQQPV